MNSRQLKESWAEGILLAGHGGKTYFNIVPQVEAGLPNVNLFCHFVFSNFMSNPISRCAPNC
jgi:hypothetical protein